MKLSLPLRWMLVALGCVALLPSAWAQVTPGELMISEMNCTACHAAEGAAATRLAARQSPRLGAAGLRLSPQWVQAFIENPSEVELGTLMPDVLHSLAGAEKGAAAEAITHYLISLQTPDPRPAPKAEAATIERGKALYHSVGCVACHTPFELPAGAEATAEKEAELAKLQETATPLGILSEKYPLNELADFLRNPLATRPSGRMPSLKLSEEEARAIAMYLLRDQVAPGSAPGSPMMPRRGAPFTVDAAKAAQGRELFRQYNCTACHQVEQLAAMVARTLADIKARQPRACLSAKPDAHQPRFNLTDRQRVVVTAALQDIGEFSRPLSPEQSVRRLMTSLNCYACHSRDRRGGSYGLQREYFTSTVADHLGEEGRIPPHLNNVGAKLQRTWIEAVLKDGATVRPYMATRMPLYGEANVGELFRLFEYADAAPDEPRQPDVTTEEAGELAKHAGRQLVGTAGLDCTKCHSVEGKSATPPTALDLASTGERLKWEWFRKYLADPQALRPGTRMPSYWPGGVAVNQEILGGNVEKQIFAIWAFLARKEFAPAPQVPAVP